MIYPTEYPKYRESGHPEARVFEILKNAFGNDTGYDIFYSREFVGIFPDESPEYEIDFIIAIPRKVIICLEVKGGVIDYDGSKWYQNREKEINPIQQAKKASYNLIKRFAGLAQNTPIFWALCFPDVANPSVHTPLPTIIAKEQLIDKKGLLDLKKHLNDLATFIQKKFPARTGCDNYTYEQFKSRLLQELHLVPLLSLSIESNEKIFVKLTQNQLKIVSAALENKKLIIEGYAGTGKTIIAENLAKKFANENKRVLFLCQQKLLASVLKRNMCEQNIEVDFLKRFVCKEESFWLKEIENPEEFWSLDVPIQIEELSKKPYDVLIIDEGQDFRGEMLDLLFKLIMKPEHRIIIFLDHEQTIQPTRQDVLAYDESSFSSWFWRSSWRDDFTSITLEENCRNTRNIVEQAKRFDRAHGIIINEDSPLGDEVIVRLCKNEKRQRDTILKDIRDLLGDSNLKVDKIIILLGCLELSKPCLSSVESIDKFPLKKLDSDTILEGNVIYYCNIHDFKGLERDIVFFTDIELDIESDFNKGILFNDLCALYTTLMRAKSLLYLYSHNKQFKKMLTRTGRGL